VEWIYDGLFVYRRVLLAWNAVVVDELTSKQMVADDLCHYLLIKRCFADWQKVSILAVSRYFCDFIFMFLPLTFLIRISLITCLHSFNCRGSLEQHLWIPQLAEVVWWTGGVRDTSFSCGHVHENC